MARATPPCTGRATSSASAPESRKSEAAATGRPPPPAPPPSASALEVVQRWSPPDRPPPPHSSHRRRRRCVDVASWSRRRIRLRRTDAPWTSIRRLRSSEHVGHVGGRVGGASNSGGQLQVRRRTDHSTVDAHADERGRGARLGGSRATDGRKEGTTKSRPDGRAADVAVAVGSVGRVVRCASTSATGAPAGMAGANTIPCEDRIIDSESAAVVVVLFVSARGPRLERPRRRRPRVSDDESTARLGVSFVCASMSGGRPRRGDVDRTKQQQQTVAMTRMRRLPSRREREHASRAPTPAPASQRRASGWARRSDGRAREAKTKGRGKGEDEEAAG